MVLALLLLLFTGCGDSTSSDYESGSKNLSESSAINSVGDDKDREVESVSSSEDKTENIIPEIYPDQIGIYIPADDGTRSRKLISDFSSIRTVGKDIDCFEAIASREKVLEGASFAEIWNNSWNDYENTENAHIGFRIRMELDNGEIISKTLLKPSDADEFFEYIEVYMYDDINQTPGAWYTHLSDSDINDDTIISSIKLTAGTNVDMVGDIELTVFVYNDMSNFDELGNYLGAVSYAVEIK